MSRCLNSRPKHSPDNTRVAIVRAHLRPIQLLILRPRWPRSILIQPANVEDSLLSWVAVWVLLITPVAGEVEPVDGRAVIVRGERTGGGVVVVVVGGQRGVCQEWLAPALRDRVWQTCTPNGPCIGIVFDRPFGKVDVGNSVVVRAAYSIVRM